MAIAGVVKHVVDTMWTMLMIVVKEEPKNGISYQSYGSRLSDPHQIRLIERRLDCAALLCMLCTHPH